MINVYRNNYGGFSLPELMMVIVVLSIITAFALPYMRVFLANVQIRTATEAMVNGIQLARAEAVRRNSNVQFTFEANTTSWTVGCETPDETLLNGVARCPATIQFRSANEGSATVALTVTPAGANRITFNGLGLVTPNASGAQTITQLDLINTSLSNTIPLRVLIQGSSIRQCNPAHNALIAGQRVTAC